MAALFVYLQNTVARLRERQEGQTMAEYALILGGIAIVVILAIVFLGGKIERPLPGDRQLGHEPRFVAPSVHAGRPRSTDCGRPAFVGPARRPDRARSRAQPSSRAAAPTVRGSAPRSSED